MYIPEAFEIWDRDTIRAFIESNGFGIVLSVQDGEIGSTHTPMYISEDMKTLYGHIAKENPQWESWSNDVKALFQGPHTYISPNDYVSVFNVPTWNYTAVSISGRIEIVDTDEAKLYTLEHLVSQYESGMESPWKLETDNKKVLRMLNGIVVFKIKIDQIQAKFKLSQNKSDEDRENVITRLRARGGELDEAIADQMAVELNEYRT